MIEHQIAFAKAGIGSHLFHDYLNGHVPVRLFYQYEPSIKGIGEAIEQRLEHPVNRQALHHVLQRQYAGINTGPEVSSNIDLLLQPNTLTITTGHQLTLVASPLFYIYKIASAISLCRHLSATHPTHHFVPVLWMNSEDHDFEEINHCWMDGQKFVWSPPDGPAIPVGNRSLENIDHFFSSILGNFIKNDTLTNVLKEWKEIYMQSKNLTEATHKLIHTLFGRYGLVIVDQQDLELKKIALPVFRNELSRQLSYHHVSHSMDLLHNLGYESQANPRYINLFYSDNQYGRNRIEVDSQNGFTVLNSPVRFTINDFEHNTETLLQALSTNVITRPLYQQSILPDIVTIGGPAEVAYWLQYKSMFDASGIFYPVVLMRDSFLFLPEKKLHKLHKLGFSISDITENPSVLLKLYIQHNEESFDPLGICDKLSELFQELAQHMGKADSTLQPAAEASLKRTLKEIKKLEEKYYRSLRKKNHLAAENFRQLHEWCYPNGVFQERITHMLDLTATPDTWIESLLQDCNPLDHHIKIISHEYSNGRT